MKKICFNIYMIITAVILIWMAASFMEILSKNTTENPTYSEGNIIIRIAEEAINND